MPLCSSCGTELGEGHLELCRHHSDSSDLDGWHLSNRAICNLIHRGIETPRLPIAQRYEVGTILDQTGLPVVEPPPEGYYDC